MNKPADELLAQLQGEVYPRALTDKYEIIENLSRADSGETLLVIDKVTGKYRVAKVRVGDEFRDQGALLAGLSHPGLPALIEEITDDTAHILIRPFVEGASLNEVVAERPLSTAEIAAIAARLCDVLAYLHGQNPPVIHRDVKPQNVILGADGAVTLIDFGIARAYKPEAKADTVYSGTHGFAPPEQYGFSQTDARADIFSLGMLMKYMATQGRMDAPVENPRLRRIIRRCTAFAPGQRYRDAECVKRALQRVEGGRGWRTLAVAALALLLGLAIGRYALPYDLMAKGVRFSQPAIEQAARMALGMPEGAITAGDLARVETLYIVHDRGLANVDDFFAAYGAWEAAGRHAEGGIGELSDLSGFVNLKRLYMACGGYDDLSPLSPCVKLEHLEVYDADRLIDIAPLKNLAQLRYVGLIKCNHILDISPLVGHEYLSDVDLGGMRTAFDPQPLADMGNFGGLLLQGSAEAYKYVAGKRIGWLRLTDGGIASMEPLCTVRDLWKLELNRTPLHSLDGIEAHAGLQYLDISSTAVTDFTPLTALSNLQTLIISESMRENAAEALSKMPAVSVSYV